MKTQMCVTTETRAVVMQHKASRVKGVWVEGERGEEEEGEGDCQSSLHIACMHLLARVLQDVFLDM